MATVDLRLPDLPDAERATLRESLQAAALPHWFDSYILAALLQVQPEEGARRLALLQQTSLVEGFPARGEGALKLHDAARLALRKQLAEDDLGLFRKLSDRAARHFAADQTRVARIEWVFHRLGAEPDQAADQLAALGRDWTGSARPEDLSALALAMRELEDAGLVAGCARVEVLLCVAEVRASRGETSQLRVSATEALGAARDCKRPSAEGRARCLLGDVLEAQGKLAEAQVAFGEYFRISRQLAEHDPSSAGWQEELAVAHSRVGGVLEAQGKLGEAQAAFEEALRISRQLAEHDPSNADWQRGLAVAHNRVGGGLEAQGKPGEAEAAFEEDLRIRRQLAEHDPSNAGWLCSLGCSLGRMATLLNRQMKRLVLALSSQKRL